MAITTIDEYTNAAFNRSQNFFTFNNVAYASSNTSLFSLWQMPGTPGSGATPATGSGAACTVATSGAVPFVAATGGRTLYLGPCGMATSAAATMYVADRLVHTSGLDGTITPGAQTVNTVALPARAGAGVGVYAALEVYTATGGTTVTATLTYTNSSGDAGRTSTASFIGGAQGRFTVFPLLGGDVGVQSVQSVALSASTTGAGNFGVTLFKPLVIIPAGVAGGAMPQNSVFDQGTPLIDANTCLFVYVLVSASAAITTYTISLVEGLWIQIRLVS
jgi:hypothetical protein